MTDEPFTSASLRITDKANGFTLEAKKPVAADSNAFDAIRHTVAVTYKIDAEGKPVVMGLCDVSPPRGLAWACLGTGKLRADAVAHRACVL